ncbi:hypothetical protein ACHQM5_000107 [Ranunculus cassubicifolius]
MFNSRAPLPVICFLTIFLVVGFAEASPSPLNITIGSSISASHENETNYWLSPSRNFAFGFHPSGNNVGIWINTSPDKTLIWSVNLHETPIDNASSILLDNDGGFILHQPGLLGKPLFDDFREPATYALMNDNGNFMIYNSMSEVIWQSFDHPTDTIVSGQTLMCGKVLVSSNSRYNLTLCDGEMVLQSPKRTIWVSQYYIYGEPVSVHLDSIGCLYLVDGYGLVTKNLTKGEEHTTTSTLYRAILESDGVLRVYAEHQSGETVELWHTYCNECRGQTEIFFWVIMALVAMFELIAFLTLLEGGDRSLVLFIIGFAIALLICAVALHVWGVRPYH